MTVLAAAAATSTSAWDQPGTLGFLVIFGMAVILYFLFRSMSRHLKKVNRAAPAGDKQQPADDKEPGGDQAADREPHRDRDGPGVSRPVGNGSARDR